MGIPSSFCRLIFQLLADLRMRVRSNGALSPSFDTFNGVPQGDPLSPLLFSLYTADIPNVMSHRGVEIDNGTEIKYLLYADDLVIISNEADELQLAIDRLDTYADRWNLTVNTAKTKCITFMLEEIDQGPFSLVITLLRM